MSRAIREHLRDVVAIIALVLAGLFASFVILANQRATFRAGCRSSASTGSS